MGISMRCARLVIGGFALLLAVLGAVWFMDPTDPINAANFARIEIGMTEGQVGHILGGPANVEAQGDMGEIPRVWGGRGYREIDVGFQLLDGKLVVASKRFFNPTMWERAKAWWGGYDLSPIGGKVKRDLGA